MSEELKHGIPKAIPNGERIIYTEEEKRKNRENFEIILKEYGILKEDESIFDMEFPDELPK